MADFTALKTAIQNAIKQNGNEEITGNLLQEVLLAIVTTLGDGSINDLITALGSEETTRGNADTTLQQNIDAEAQARQLTDSTLQGGINTAMQAINAINNAITNGCVYAGIATPSSTPASGKVFYLALTAGTYTNYGGLEVPQGINILKNNGSTWSLDSFLGIDDAPTPSSNKLVKSGGVFNDIMTNGSAFDLSAYNNGTTYADLNAALTALNTLPAAYKRGGMSFKFVLTSDNNYKRFDLIADEFTTDITKWQGVDDELTENSINLAKSGVVYNKTNLSKHKVYGDIFPKDVASVEHHEYIYARTDKNGKLIETIDKDLYKKYYGSVSIEGEVEGKGGTKTLVDKDIEEINKLKDDTAYAKVSTDHTGKMLEATDVYGNKIVFKDLTVFGNLNTPNSGIPSLFAERNAITLGDSHSDKSNRDIWLKRICKVLNMNYLEALNQLVLTSDPNSVVESWHINPLISQAKRLVQNANQNRIDVIFIEEVHFDETTPSTLEDYPLNPSKNIVLGTFNMTQEEEEAYFNANYETLLGNIEQSDREANAVLTSYYNAITKKLTFSADAVSAGTLTITIDGSTFNVEVTSEMTLADVVGAMNLWQFGDYTDWHNSSYDDDSITLIYKGDGEASMTFSYNGGTTGITVSAGQNVQTQGTVHRYFANNNVSNWLNLQYWKNYKNRWSYPYSWLKGCIEILQKAFPQALIVVCGVPDYALNTNITDIYDYQHNNQSYLKSARGIDKMISVGKMYSCKTIDLDKESGISVMNWFTYHNNFDVHYKEIGYVRIADTIIKNLI